MARKALLLLVTFFSLLIMSSGTVSAQDTIPWSNKYDEEQVTSYTEAVLSDGCATPSLECLVHQTFRFVAIEMTNNIIPAKTGGPVEAGANIPESEDASIERPGMVAGINSLIGEMYTNPPARTSVYVADIMNSAHITPRAYAQGLGFASLNPILELWKAFRNLAYMFFVFVFIIIGFMIMFRKRIGGQTAVTAQQAIPSVIISLIMVTFSYAIAGFLIDLMYVTMFLIIGIFGQTLPSGSENIIDYNILGLMSELFGIVNPLNASSIDSVDIVTNLLDSVVESEAASNVLGLIGGLTLSLVLAIAVLIGTFKLFFELLKSYVTVVISVVTAPLDLMMGAIPGNNRFMPWMKNIIANLSPFPVVLLVVVLFYQFTSLNTGGASTEGGFIPPFLLGRGQAGAVSTLMGLAIILALPEIVKDVKKRLGASEGFGTMVAKAAGDSAKKGWTGGQPIPGIPVKIPGVQRFAKAGGAGAKYVGPRAMTRITDYRERRSASNTKARNETELTLQEKINRSKRTATAQPNRSGTGTTAKKKSKI